MRLAKYAIPFRYNEHLYAYPFRVYYKNTPKSAEQDISKHKAHLIQLAYWKHFTASFEIAIHTPKESKVGTIYDAVKEN